MDKFEGEGCPLLDPDYYDLLGDRYSILNRHRSVYRNAAAAGQFMSLKAISFDQEIKTRSIQGLTSNSGLK